MRYKYVFNLVNNYTFLMKGNGLGSVQLNGDREGSPHQEPNENRHPNFSRKEKKEILVSSLQFCCLEYCLLIQVFVFQVLESRF